MKQSAGDSGCTMITPVTSVPHNSRRSAGNFSENRQFAARLRAALGRALPPARRSLDVLARAMGHDDADRYDTVLDGKLFLPAPEIDRIAAMIGVSAGWLKTGTGHPFGFGLHQLSDDPLDLISLMTQPHPTRQGFGTPASITFVACAYPLYGPVLILRQFAGTRLTPYRFDVVATSTRLDVPGEGGWHWDPGCLLTHLAFLAHLHVGRGGHRGQGISSMIVSDDTYDALSRGDVHIRDMPILIRRSTWHLDLLDQSRLTDPEWEFRNWRDWQAYGLWAMNHLVKDRVRGTRFTAYCKGDHPDFTEAFAQLDTRPVSKTRTLATRSFLDQEPVIPARAAMPSPLMQ